MSTTQAVSSSSPFIPYLPSGAVPLQEGESLLVEPGGMLSFKNLDITTKTSSHNLFHLFKSYCLGGEALLCNRFTAKPGGGWILFEESQPGQTGCITLYPGQNGVVLKSGAYLASCPHVTLDTKISGIQGYFRGTGFGNTVARVQEGQKPGQIYFQSNEGMMKEMLVSKEEGPLTVDNSTIVGYTEGLDVTIKKLNGWRSLLFSSEGLVCQFSGQGAVYVGSTSQTNANLLSIALKQASSTFGKWAATSALCVMTGTGLAVGFFHMLPPEKQGVILEAAALWLAQGELL